MPVSCPGVNTHKTIKDSTVFRAWGQHPHGCCLGGFWSYSRCGEMDLSSLALGPRRVAALGRPACLLLGSFCPAMAPQLRSGTEEGVISQ